MTDFLRRGGPWAVAQGCLLLAVIVLASRYRGKERRPSCSVSGGILLASGATIALAGVSALGKNITPFPKPREHARLVQSGIFSVLRHPVYAGVGLASLGWALLCQSVPALLAGFALIPFLDAKARREEKWLREKFHDYREYELSVSRFVPWIY